MEQKEQSEIEIIVPDQRTSDEETPAETNRTSTASKAAPVSRRRGSVRRSSEIASGLRIDGFVLSMICMFVLMFGFFGWMIYDFEVGVRQRTAEIEPLIDSKLVLTSDILASDKPEGVDGSVPKRDEKGNQIEPAFRLKRIRTGTIICPRVISPDGRSVKIEVLPDEPYGRISDVDLLLYVSHRALRQSKPFTADRKIHQ